MKSKLSKKGQLSKRKKKATNYNKGTKEHSLKKARTDRVRVFRKTEKKVIKQSKMNIK